MKDDREGWPMRLRAVWAALRMLLAAKRGKVSVYR